MVEPVDILAIGAHPDDVEYSMAGTLLVHRRLGYRIGIVDLTRAELGSKGSPELRHQEAERAAQRLGAVFRVNLDLGDNHVLDIPEAARRLAQVIRQARPTLVFTHHGDDRHPDHRGAWALTRRAVFMAALQRLDLGHPHHVVQALLFYPSNEVIDPDVLVDVSDVWSEREEVMRCYKSQFVDPTLEIDHRYFGVYDYMDTARVRARHYGQLIGVQYAEAFTCHSKIKATDLVAMFR